jgi:hypothetical protein
MMKTIVFTVGTKPIDKNYPGVCVIWAYGADFQSEAFIIKEARFIKDGALFVILFIFVVYSGIKITSTIYDPPI